MNATLLELLAKKIFVLDGATGSMIQTFQLTESDFRGDRFKNWDKNLKGNNDLLCLTKPEVVTAIHEAYLQAGADLIETNSFNATFISLADYGMEGLAYEINKNAASLAKAAAQKYSALTPDKPRFVVGSMGPTNKTASMSPDVSDPAARSITFDALVQAYREQISGLRDGGADILLVETIFDTLNAKAALFAIEQEAETTGIELPVMISVTVADTSGRTLSGQTLKAFLTSVSHLPVLSIGMNCGFGATQMRPYLEELANSTAFRISLHPNAGLPNQLGEYDELPETMAKTIEEYLQKGWINIIGGCCGTRPAHIAAIAEVAKKYVPRPIQTYVPQTWVSGLEPLHIHPESNFINIGERCNVAGSRKFARLMKEEKFEEALSIARLQVENGAQVLDICMDDAMLDAQTCMVHFLHLIASEPEISKVPLMIDSSKWEVIEAGLKCVQGKSIVNSISLKEGEAAFLEKARLIHRYGAAVVVMLFDENGQADSYDRKIQVAKRSYDLLVQHGFPAEDIIFDPNVLAIATGIAEHDNYGVDFIQSCTWIKANLPHAKISGGISNLSFSFRGNDLVREAIHSVFLYHAIKAGLDMGIVNAGQMTPYDQIDVQLLKLTEDVVLNRRSDATEEMLSYADQLKISAEPKLANSDEQQQSWRNLPVEERLKHALVRGISDFLEQDITECIALYPVAIDIIEGPLMQGMNTVGDLFGDGKMFLPQVVKSARVMKACVAILEPLILSQKKNAETKPVKFLLATVKGDVHDIGKNIVSVVLSCNGFEIIDLGVMVPGEKIIEEAIKHQVDAVGLSGLITPSLDEMAKVCRSMQEKGMDIPILIGGATTSELHTSIKIAPTYEGGVFYVKDASRASNVLKNVTDQHLKSAFRKETDERYANVRAMYEQTRRKSDYLKLTDARSNGLKLDWTKEHIPVPNRLGITEYVDFPLSEIIPFIDWTYFFYTWDMRGTYPAVLDHPEKGKEARILFEDANLILKDLERNQKIKAKAVVGLFPANASGDDIVVDKNGQQIPFYHLRDQRKRAEGEPNLCLSDFIAPKESGIQDYIGGFSASIFQQPENLSQQARQSGDDYTALLIETLCDRLVEAFAELLHLKVRKELWGYAPNEPLDFDAIRAEKYSGIRPAIGYPACPDHSEKLRLFELLEVTKRTGASLTDSYMMNPASSVCGFYLANPAAKYYNIIHITKDQADDYFKRKGRVFEPMRQFII